MGGGGIIKISSISQTLHTHVLAIGGGGGRVKKFAQEGVNLFYQNYKDVNNRDP